MTPEEILEGNTLIAEFMGEEIVDDRIHSSEHPKYHYSWDWLMFVINKLEGLGYRFKIYTDHTTVFYSNTIIHKPGNNKIINTYLAIQDIIKYHNAQQQDNGTGN